MMPSPSWRSGAIIDDSLHVVAASRSRFASDRIGAGAESSWALAGSQRRYRGPHGRCKRADSATVSLLAGRTLALAGTKKRHTQTPADCQTREANSLPPLRVLLLRPPTELALQNLAHVQLSREGLGLSAAE